MFFENLNRCGCRCCPVKPQCPICPCDDDSNAYGTIYNIGDSTLTIATPNTYVPVTLNTQGPASNTIPLPNAIRINNAGTYAVYYRLNLNATSTESQTATAAVFDNGNIIAPTSSSAALVETTEGNYAGVLTAESIVELNEGDVLTLQITSDTAGSLTLGHFGDATLLVKEF